MPQTIACPKCRAAIPLPAKTAPGQKLKCPKCAREVALPTAPVKAGKSHAGLVAAPPAKAGKSHAGVAPAPARRAGVAAAPVSLDFNTTGGGLVAAPKLRREPGPIAKMIKRVMLFGCLGVVLLGVCGGGGTGIYFLGKKYDWFSKSAAVAQVEDTKPSTNTKDTKPNPEDEIPKNPVNQGTGQEDPLAYVPADANVIVGLSGDTLLTDKLTQEQMANQLVAFGLLKLVADCKKTTGVELKDLFNSMIIAMKSPAGITQPEVTTVILRSSVAFDQKKMGQWATPTGAKKLKDKYYYDKHQDLPAIKTVYMPSSNILVLSEVPAAKWDTLFTTDGIKPALSADAVSLVRQVEKNPAWVVLAFDAKAKENARGGLGPVPLLWTVMPNDLRPTFQKILPEAKGMTFRLTKEKDDLTLAMGVGCLNDAHATELNKALQASWTKNKPNKAKQIQNALLLDFEPRQKLMNGFVNSLQFTQQGVLVEASLKAGLDPLTVLLKDGLPGFQAHTDELLAAVGTELGLPPLPEKPVVLSDDEKKLLELVNDFRKKEQQLPPLKPNARLMAVARMYAANMAKENKADDEVDMKDTVIRVKDVGYKFKKEKIDHHLAGGENLKPEQAFAMWKNGVAKAEILLGEFDETGIGIAKNADKGTVFYYQIYASPDK